MAVIDLSQLPAPQIVDVPDFETLLAERKAEFVALHPKDEQEAVIRTLELESEPVTKLLQENAYRELLLRQRINEAAQAVMVAYAMGGDLDQLAANYNVKRLTVTPADNDAVPPVAAVMESDEALRLRVPAAFEGLSVAGPTAAYEFHARSADGRVADASATSPAPAEVVLTVLSREGDGTAEKDLLDVVEKALNSENVRPVADRLTVRSAEIIPYRVEATIFLYPGPEAEPVMAAAKASLQKYIASQTRLGRDIRRSAIFAALHVEGVQRVELASPLADVVLNKTQAASCTEWSVTNGERMNSLLPSGSTSLERRLAQTCSGISDLQVPLRDLWNPATCPVSFLPYLAWAFSVDRWDEGWTESVKRQVVKDAFYIHQHKGTTSAVRRVVEPFGFLIRIIEWWQTGEAPGTFRLDIGVQDQGITEDIYLELERLISDAKPCSRHMIGMSINLQTSGPYWVGAASYLGEEITIYPYINETIISGGTAHEGGAVHVIDTMRVNP